MMRKIWLVGTFCSVCLAVACQRPGPTQDAGEWPQFRGPGGAGVSLAEGLPETWDEDGSNILWRAELAGRGNSSPIVSGRRTFLTAARVHEKEAERLVIAVDLDTGDQLWETALGISRAGKKHRLNTYAAPTPVTDGQSVFVHFGDILAALDLQGQILWQKEIDSLYHGNTVYGAASSPVLTRNAIIVAQDREDTKKPMGWLAAYDKVTGEEIWKNSWSNTCCSYTTPLIRQRGTHEEIILAKAGSVTSYDAETGDELWLQHLDINQPVASPLMEDDLLVVFSGAHNVRHGAVMRVSGEGPGTEVEILWQTKQIIPQTSTPVLYRGMLYTLVDKGVLACYDALTGGVHWRQRLGGGGGYHASLLAGDGKIYVSSRPGYIQVLEAGVQFREIAVNKLEGGVTSTPAFAGQSLLIRTSSGLYRVSDPGTQPAG